MSALLLRLNAILLVILVSTSAGAETYLVNSTADPGDGICDGTCMLRDAIIASNASPGQDTIDFSGIVMPNSTVPVTIMLFAGLPAITDSVIMDATITETRALPGNPLRRPGIELNLSAAAPIFGAFGIPFFPNGLSIGGPGATGSEVRGFVINGINRFSPELCALAFFNPDPVDPTVPATDFCSNSIGIFGANGVVIAGNYLNMNTEGDSLSGNGVTAIALVDASNSVIGGDTADDRNVMTAKDFQVGDDNGSYTMIRPLSLGWASVAYGTPKRFNNNRIVGNYLGVTASGNALNPDVRGIWMTNENIIDSPVYGPIGWGAQCADQEFDPCEMKSNVIEGNTLTSRGGRGTFVFSGDQYNTVLNDNTVFNTADFQGKMEVFERNTGIPVNMLVTNNRMGVDSNGIASTGPTDFGLTVRAADRVRIENNIITGGFLDGVWILDNSPRTAPSLNVTLSQNSIFDNCTSGDPLCQGILLGNVPGPNPNDFLDPDFGANHLQNFPVLLEIEPINSEGVVKISAELNSSPSQVYLIEFFSNSKLNAAGRAEGERFLGQKTVVANKVGHARFTFNYNEQKNGVLAMDGGGNTFITATATRKHCEPKTPGCLYGSTSAFSLACEWDTNQASVTDCEE